MIRRRMLVMFVLSLFAGSAQAGRVVTLAPHLAELVCAAGACEQLVGVVKHSDYPAEVLRRAQIGDAFAVNAEAVLALKPDLVLSWAGGTPEQTVARLRRVGLRVEPVRVRSLDDVGLAVLRVGALLGTEDAACAAEHRFRDQITALRQRYLKAPPIRAMYQIEAEPIFTVNGDSPISEAFALCGASNIFADYQHLAGPVGRESVLAANPDVIVFGRRDGGPAIRASWQRFPTMRAVRAGNLVEVDADTLARATPRMAEGAAALCEALDAARARLAGLR